MLQKPAHSLFGLIERMRLRPGPEFYLGQPRGDPVAFAHAVVDAGADLAVVRSLAGQANVQTTARYNHRGDAAKRQAVDLLHVPFEEELSIVREIIGATPAKFTLA